MCSGADVDRNIVRALFFCNAAVRRKAEFVLLPEVCLFRGSLADPRRRRDIAQPVPGKLTRPFQEFARRYKIYLLLGSVHERIRGSSKVFNTSVLIDPRGRVIAKYRKIHLFRARLPGRSIDESENLKAGKKSVVANIKGFKAGLTICYDLRFPWLYRECARRGAQILLVPSAFTRPTGKAHFETLLRARAIVDLCYVLAPDQVGSSVGGVSSFGNSMIVDPWGKVIARADGRSESILMAYLDFSRIRRARRAFPAVIG